MIPTVPISEIPRLLLSYVDEGTGLQIMRHYLSWTDPIKPSLLFSNVLRCISKGSFLQTILFTLLIFNC